MVDPPGDPLAHPLHDFFYLPVNLGLNVGEASDVDQHRRVLRSLSAAGPRGAGQHEGADRLAKRRRHHLLPVEGRDVRLVVLDWHPASRPLPVDLVRDGPAQRQSSHASLGALQAEHPGGPDVVRGRGQVQDERTREQVQAFVVGLGISVDEDVGERRGRVADIG